MTQEQSRLPYLSAPPVSVGGRQRKNSAFATSYSLMNSWCDYPQTPRQSYVGRVLRVMEIPPPAGQTTARTLIPGVSQSANLDTRLPAIDNGMPPMRDPYGNPFMNGAHMQFGSAGSGGHDDRHKAFLNFQMNADNKGASAYPYFGPPRLRYGHGGGNWRHVKEVLQAGGSRTIFVDGQDRILDNSRLTDEEVPLGNLIQQSVKNVPKKKPGYTTDRYTMFVSN